MTTLLHAKRALERRVRCHIEFRRTPTEEHPITVHATEPQCWDSLWDSHESTWLGSGDTHHEAIADCYETMAVRRKIDLQSGWEEE